MHTRSRVQILATLALVLVAALDARAALLSRGGGQAYYDDVADLTWVAVASLSTNSGAATGLDWYVTHQSSIDAHTVDGVGGWRMPRADVNGDGIVLAACAENLVCRDNEMGYLSAAHGVTQLDPLPFDLHGAAQFFSSTAISGTIYNAFDFATGTNQPQNIATNRGFALLVQTGDVLGAPGSEGPDLITNGSFENGVAIAPSAFLPNLGVGNGGITSWNIASGNVDYIGSHWQAPDGARSLDMSGSTWGSIYQRIPTVPGNRYRVRFDLAGNPGGPPAKRLRVTAADQLQIYDFDATGRTTSNMGWTAHAFEFTAWDSTTDIYFVSLTAGSYGPALDNVRAFDLGPPPSAPANGAALETIEVFQFELIYNDGGSGAAKDGAFHRPIAPPGYYVLSHQGQNHYNVPGFYGEAGRSVLAVRALEPGALAPPDSFVWIWNDSESGATMNASAWKPMPPDGYECLGTFISREWISPDVSTNPITLRDLSEFRCVRSDLVVQGAANGEIWTDKENGGTNDFSAWYINPISSTGLGVGGILGSPLWTTPTDTVYVLDAADVREAALPALDNGPYLELDMLRDRVVSGACDWDVAIYNDTGTGSDTDVAWWHPQNIPTGYHQLGHTYERFHNPDCSLDPVIVAQELVVGALAAPIGWDNNLATPEVDPVWNDIGSGGGNNGAIWRPNPPPGYVCLGSFATGGYGYAPPDDPVYQNSSNVIDQQVEAASQNFRCVREDLTVPARVSEWGWTDSGSGASRSLAMFEIDPADYTGTDVGIDVGHFVGVNQYRMPVERLRTINSRAVAQAGILSQANFQTLLDKGPKLRIHPDERYMPDDPRYSLDNDISLCSGPVPGLALPGGASFASLGPEDSRGEICDFAILALPTPVPWWPFWWPVPIDLSVNAPCPIHQPNPDPGTFYGSPIVCESTTAATLSTRAAEIQDASNGVPDWQRWLEVDVGPLDPTTGLPQNPTGNIGRAKATVRVRPWNGVGHEVQYWIWYPYNGPGKMEAGCGVFEAPVELRVAGRHSGDWEVISLRYDDGLELVEVYLSRHDGEEIVPVKPVPGGLTGPILADGLQPIVYAARDSHAHYTGTGQNTYKEPFSLGLGVCTVYLRLYDLTSDADPQASFEIDLSESDRLIMASSEYTTDLFPDGETWIQYRGRWGGYEALATSGEIYVDGILIHTEDFDDIGAGPTGPITKGIWREEVPEPSGGLVVGVFMLIGLATARRKRRPDSAGVA